VPAIDGLSLATKTERALVLGAPRALFLATCAQLPVARGKLTIRGQAPEAAVRGKLVAGAPLDPPLPPKWTPLEYATWSARLASVPKADAAAQAAAAIEKLQLAPLAKQPLAKIAPHARRATVVAAALATGAEVIALEDPVGNLPEDVARTWGRFLAQALEGKSWIAFAARLSLTSPLALHAEEAIVVDGGARTLAQGPPAELATLERKFVLRVHGPFPALAPKLAERGARLEQDGASNARVVVDLGETLTTAELLALCIESNVTVVELLPVGRALA